MHTSTRLRAIVGIVLGVALGARGDAHAEPQRTESCRGADLIARLAERDPIGHRRIVQRAGEMANSQAMFWLIEKDGLEPSYLLGTVHLTDDRAKRLPIAAEIAFERARHVAVETYFDSAEDVGSVLEGMSAKAVASEVHRLSDHLSAAEMTALLDLSKHAKLSRDEIDQLNPWVAEMLIRGQSCEAQRIEKGELVLDAWIAGRAMRQGLPLRKLETVGEQFETLASIPFPAQIAMLRYALTEKPASADDEMETMIGLYLRRQIPAADALTRMLAPDPRMADLYLAAFWNDLINRRNIRFVANAAPLLAEGRVFIAIGAAHLPGDAGVVQLLRDDGYTVTAADEGPSPEAKLAAVAEPPRKSRRKAKRRSTKLADLAKQALSPTFKPDRVSGRK